jgi:hypothetical protein
MSAQRSSPDPLELGGSNDLRRHPARVEHFHHLCEVRERGRQSVDFLDQHDVDESSADIVEQLLQRRSFHVAARKSAVIMCALDKTPALTGLTPNEGFARFTLGMQRVEGLFQSLFGGLAGALGQYPRYPRFERVEMNDG